MANIDWYNTTFSAGISTAFGEFDQDPEFVTDSTKVLRYVVRSLGYPSMQLQIYPEHIFTAFESATMKYSTIVNEYKISDNLLNVYGQDPSQDLSKASIMGSLNAIFEISSMYGQQAIIRNSLNTEIYTTSIKVKAGIQEYNLADYIPQYTNSNVQILQIYHYPRMYNTAVFDPMINPGFNMASVMMEFGGVYASNARLVIMPIFETLLKMQTLELTQQIRRSHFGFQIRKNKIIFYPTPNDDTDIMIDYILKSDKFANSIKDDTINNVSNFPIKNYLKYSDINTPGRNWIQRFTLALTKQILGIVRSKYSTVPYPQGDTSLDGETLRQEAVTEQDKLIEELKIMLQESSMSKLIQKKKDIAQNLQIINSKVPSRIFIG